MNPPKAPESKPQRLRGVWLINFSPARREIQRTNWAAACGGNTPYQKGRRAAYNNNCAKETRESERANMMTRNDSIVAIYPSHSTAEAAVKELQQSGFDMKKLSIVGRDYHTDEHVVGYYNTGDRMKRWGKTGAFWGGIWGWLFGSAFFFIPGIGPLVMAGPLVGWLVGALEGAVVVGGLSALGAGLYGLGIPKDSVLQYETALKTDRFLLIAQGSADEINRAKEILNRTKPEALEHHQ
jgi:hypothetical protein